MGTLRGQVSFGTVHPQMLKPEHIAMLEEVGKLDSDCTIVDVLKKLAGDKAQIWLYERVEEGFHGLVVTQIHEVYHSKILYVWKVIGAGMVNDLVHIHDTLMAYGQAQGCTRVRLEVQPYLVEPFLNHVRDFKVTQMILEKEIPNGEG